MSKVDNLDIQYVAIQIVWRTMMTKISPNNMHNPTFMIISRINTTSNLDTTFTIPTTPTSLNTVNIATTVSST